MSGFQITAEARTITGKKVSQLRRQELVPCTIYGPATPPLSVQFGYRELQRLLASAGSTNIIEVTYGDRVMRVLAREVQRDVIRGTILHVDFFAVDENKKIRVDVPVVLVGESPIIASRKAILMSGATRLRIEVLPRDLVNKIEVNLSPLTAVGSAIYVKDLTLPAGITVLSDPDEMVARALQTGAQRSAAKA